MQFVGHRREGAVVLVWALCVMVVAGCGPAVGEGRDAGTGLDVEEGLGLVGRYGVYFSDERRPLFLGDVILKENGQGDFLPEWACNEEVRSPLRWTAKESDEGGTVFDLAVEESGQEKGLRISGPVEGCFEEVLDGEFGALRSRVLLLPNEGYCLDEISDTNGAWSEEGCLVEPCEITPAACAD